MTARAKTTIDHRPLAPIHLQITSVELQAQVEAVAAAAGVSSISTQLAGGMVSAVLVDLASLPRGGWQRLDVPTLLVGHEDQEGELWLAAANLGLDRVVPLPKAANWLAEFLSGLHSERSKGRIIAVIGGCGGAGATTITGLLGIQLNRAGHRCLLIDADPWGAGIERILGSEQVPGLSWQDLATSSGSFNSEEFARGLPELASASVLGFGPMGRSTREPATRAVQRSAAAVIDAARRSFEMVLVDVGRNREFIEIFCAQADALLCILPANLLAVLATHRMIDSLPAERLQLVVRGPLPEGLDAELVAEYLGVPLLGSIPRMRGVKAAAEQGALAPLAAHRTVERLSVALMATLEGRSG